MSIRHSKGDAHQRRQHHMNTRRREDLLRHRRKLYESEMQRMTENCSVVSQLVCHLGCVLVSGDQQCAQPPICRTPTTIDSCFNEGAFVWEKTRLGLSSMSPNVNRRQDVPSGEDQPRNALRATFYTSPSGDYRQFKV
jgi:hypothetical protein